MPARIVVMGVSGCGKTVIGGLLAARIGAAFIDGDDLHPAANIEKMSRGEPLDDADRGPWLDKVAAALATAGGRPVVVGCSALRRAYRDRIRRGAGGPVGFVHLAGSRDVLAKRMAARKRHFMPVSLLDSQLATLEPPEADEEAVTIDIDQPREMVVARAVAWLERSGL